MTQGGKYFERFYNHTLFFSFAIGIWSLCRSVALPPCNAVLWS